MRPGFESPWGRHINRQSRTQAASTALAGSFRCARPQSAPTTSDPRKLLRSAANSVESTRPARDGRFLLPVSAPTFGQFRKFAGRYQWWTPFHWERLVPSAVTNAVDRRTPQRMERSSSIKACSIASSRSRQARMKAICPKAPKVAGRDGLLSIGYSKPENGAPRSCSGIAACYGDGTRIFSQTCIWGGPNCIPFLVSVAIACLTQAAFEGVTAPFSPAQPSFGYRRSALL
jgi:hypothetical protein